MFPEISLNLLVYILCPVLMANEPAFYPFKLCAVLHAFIKVAYSPVCVWFCSAFRVPRIGVRKRSALASSFFTSVLIIDTCLLVHIHTVVFWCVVSVTWKFFFITSFFSPFEIHWWKVTLAGLILGWRPDNERLCYFVTTSLIGWAQA